MPWRGTKQCRPSEGGSVVPAEASFDLDLEERQGLI